MPVHDNAQPVSLTLPSPLGELPALLEHFQWLWVATDRTLVSSDPLGLQLRDSVKFSSG